MSVYQTVSNILTDILFRSGEDPSNVNGDYYLAAQRAIVRAYHDIGGHHPFLWSRVNPPGVFTTLPPITATLVTVTTGSTTITFGSAPQNPVTGGNVAVQGRKLRVAGTAEFYRIASHTSGSTSAILDSGFNGPSGASQTCVIYQDEYDLTPVGGIDIRTLEGVFIAETGEEVFQRSETVLRTEYPDVTASWPPRYFARIGETRIRLDGYPTLARRIEFSYTGVLQEPDLGGTVPILIPLNWRYVLADGGLYWLYIELNDNRAQAAGQSYAGGLDRMIDDDIRKRVGTATNRPGAGPYG